MGIHLVSYTQVSFYGEKFIQKYIIVHDINDQMPSRQTAFFSAVEELDLTLAVVLGRPRLGTRI